MKRYIAEVENAMRKRHTRNELRALFRLGTGRAVPPGANLRRFVAKWHAHQQAINGGAVTSLFWRRAVGVS